MAPRIVMNAAFLWASRVPFSTRRQTHAHPEDYDAGSLPEAEAADDPVQAMGEVGNLSIAILEAEREAAVDPIQMVGEVGNRSAANLEVDGEVQKVACPKPYVQMWGDYPNGDHFGGGFTKKADTVDACADECNNVDACHSFEYAPSTKFCFRNLALAPTQDATAGWMFCSKATCPDGYKLLFGDYPNGDYFGGGYTKEAPSVEACGTDCSNTNGCRSFEYAPSTKKCFRNFAAEPTQAASAGWMFCSKVDVLMSDADVKLRKGDLDAQWNAGMKPPSSSDEQVWNLRKCSSTDGAVCLANDAAWSAAAAVTSGDVVAWLNKGSQRVQDCSGATCTLQPFPPPAGHWGTPFKIIKVDGSGNEAPVGSSINKGDTVYFYGQRGINVWDPTWIINCDPSKCGGSISPTITGSTFTVA